MYGGASISVLSRAKLFATLLISMLVLTACGGGESADTASGDSNGHRLGGSVSGLTSTGLTLSVNGEGSYQIPNGPYTLPVRLDSGENYVVAVNRQPTGQTCRVFNGSGTVNSSDITNINITCASGRSFAIGGSVLNLAQGQSLILRDVARNVNYTVNANGTYQLAGGVPSNAKYRLTVQTHPSGQICGVTSGAGTAFRDDDDAFSIVCIDASQAIYRISGSVTGTTQTVILRNDRNGDEVTVSGSGNFTFEDGMRGDASYNLDVVQPIVGCSVSPANGSVNNNNVNVTVTCNNSSNGLTLSGTVSGLTGSLVLQESSSGRSLTVTGSSFSFSNMANGSYSLSISTQPTGQSCSITSGASGFLSGNISNVQINCSGGTGSLSLGGSISGLSGTLSLREDVSGRTINVTSGSTSFNFANLASGSYQLSVAQNPTGQSCTINSGASGFLNSSISNVSIACVASTGNLTLGGTVSGLTGTLVLREQNSNRSVEVTGSSFSFTNMNSGSYSLTVSSQPAGQNCSITSGASGSLSGNVSNVAVTCSGSTGTLSLGGTISGLTGSVTLREDISGRTVVATGSSFAFNNMSSGSYRVSIASHPQGQTCSVISGATGTLLNDISNVLVSCTSGGTGTGQVQALYPDSGSNWNDYVQNNGSTPFNASGAACTGFETSGCLHGGELRVVNVGGQSSCTGLTAVDSADAFEWVCDQQGASVRMISTGFKRDKGLADLIDWNATPAWKNLSVTVRNASNVDLLTTTASRWWSNLITPLTNASLFTSGTIYTLGTANASVYSFAADKTALVVQPGIVVQSSLGGTQSSGLVEASNRKFIWLEGHFDATQSSNGIYLSSTQYAVMNNVTVSTSNGDAMVLEDSSRNRLQSIVASNGNNGIRLQNANDNMLRFVNVSHNAMQAPGNVGAGLSLQNSSRNRGWMINAFVNGSEFSEGRGIELLNQSNDNSFAGVTAANNSNGIFMGWETGQISHNNVFINVTAANNGIGSGVFTSGNSNTFVNAAIVSNSEHGMVSYASQDMSLINVASSDNGAGQLNSLFLSNVENTYVGGRLLIGSGCWVGGGSNPGISHGTQCSLAGSTSATVTPGQTLATSFVGRPQQVDTTNLDARNNNSNRVAINTITDWGGFNNALRGWGISEPTLQFPAAGLRGPHRLGSSNFAIWDWSVRFADSRIRALFTAPVSADAADTFNHSWSDNVTTRFLRNAVEIVGDLLGNENGLCESNESCLFTPNIGSYQGHGGMQATGNTLTGSALQNIRLYRYTSNGR